jgi:GNAT superfamily N-acetyltransferase
MGKVAIRALTSDDISQIHELFQTRNDLGLGGAEKRATMLEYIAFNNPYANGEPTYFVADDGERIVGHLGRMPMQFIVKGKVRKGYFIHDLYVHPDYRASGKGFFISNALYKKIEDDSKSFCCLVWTTELNLEMQRRRGYFEAYSDRYYRLSMPYAKLKKFVRSNALAKVISLSTEYASKIADAVLMRVIHDNAEIIKIEHFDSRFDLLNERLLDKTGICPNKSSKYLNWRLLELPYIKMEAFAAQKDSQILGYIAVCVTEKEGYAEGVIADIMADPKDKKTIRSLFKKAVQYFREKKVKSVRCCLSDRHYSKIIKQFLYMKDVIKSDPVMLANLNKVDEQNYLKDMGHWHITCCASDSLMLEF